jgi:hypothetical protein
MLLTIAVIEKWSCIVSPAGLAAASCHKKKKKPSAFVPRRLVRIVTATPPKVFLTLIDSWELAQRRAL